MIDREYTRSLLGADRQLAIQYFKEYKLEYLFELKQHFVRMLNHAVSQWYITYYTENYWIVGVIEEEIAHRLVLMEHDHELPEGRLLEARE